MNSLRYLNTVLTVLALLLAMNLWTAWSSSPASPSMATEAQAVGIPDAGAQRSEMINLLKALNQRHDDLADLLQSGDVRVRVILPDED